MTPRYEAPSRSISGTDADLLDQLRYADGRPYGFYKNALGAWDYGDFTLAIDHVQADPYAPPSSLRAWTRPEAMGLPEAALASPDARLAAGDFIARAFDEAIRARGARDVSIARAGALILQRSYATVLPDRVEVRFQVKLPARGRTILGKSAARLFDVDVPNIVMDCFDFVSEDPATTRKRSRLLGHVAAYEDYRALQGILEDRGWVSFVADEAMLARRSGVSEAPLAGDGVVAFAAPESLRATVTLPHAGEVSGMAIPPGLTLIVGGGYHGKSTLLEAIAQGVYAHVPGDGRELVATDPTATKVRAPPPRARRRRAAPPEPITPLVDRVTSLTEAGISLIMVVGGSGAFLDAADRVLMMDNYHCLDVTSRARSVVADLPRPRTDTPTSWEAAPRVPAAKARVDRPRTKASGTSVLTIDRSTIDISDVAAVVDPGQAEAIAWCVRGVLEEMAGKQSMPDLMAKLGRRLASEGLDAVCKFGARPYPAFLARPRLIDVGAAINRYRGLALREARGEGVAGEASTEGSES